MKRKLLIGITAFAVCMSMFAGTKICVKLDDGQIVKYEMDKVVGIHYEVDSFIVDASETFLAFEILTDTTVEVSWGS